MDKISDWYFALIFFAGILGFIVAAILLFANRTYTFPSRLLAGFLITMSILAINYGLMVTSFYVHHPHLWRAFLWASFSFAPFAYLYVRSVLEQSYKFRRSDYLWFLPAVLFTLNMLPFYTLPVAEKIAYLQKVAVNSKIITSEEEGFLPKGWAAWCRVLLGVVTTTGQFILLAKWKNRILNSKESSQQNIGLYKWLFLFSTVLAIFFSIIILEFVFHFSSKSDLNYPIIFTISGAILFVSISLLVRPSILYGMTGWLQQPETPEKVAIPEQIAAVESGQGKQSLSLAQATAYKKAIESHFNNKLPYRKNGYTIGDLSQEINIPSYQLSAFINQEYGKNFNELVNEFRVHYLAGLLKKSPEYFQFTLEALGKLAGFNTRASFIAAVKKNTGKTPSEFYGKKSDPITADLVQSS